jgi:hypothetical protein
VRHYAGQRLPNRLSGGDTELTVGGVTLTATIGFDETEQPAEIFLSGAKDGSGLASILADAV